MMKSIRPLVAAVALSAVAVGAHADVAMYVKGGTLGLGAGLGYSLTDNLNLRAGYNAYSYDKDFEKTDVNYEGEVDFKSGELLVDWHPFSGSFRLTAGAYLNNNEITGKGKPTGGTYELNGNTYAADEIGSLDANIDFKEFSPYVGIGWGNILDKDGHFTFTADIGALYQGSPNVSAKLTCGPAADAATCAQAQSDVDAEVQDLSDDVDSYKWWPVVSLGLGYRF